MNNSYQIMTNEKYDFIFKIILIGDSGVGKTSLLSRYADDVFLDKPSCTVNVDFKTKVINVGGKSIKLQIWDTAGQERFKCMPSAYYRNSNGVFIVYDITDRESFENVQTWMKQLDSYGPDDVCRVLIGNKSDLEKMRAVKTEEGITLARKYNMSLFFETSAKGSVNVKEMFEKIAKKIANYDDEKYYQFNVYVPLSHLEIVKKAIGDAGAGKLGNYDHCMWTTIGSGQFRPLAGSNPYIGTKDVIEHVEEAKIEFICKSEDLKTIISEMKRAHPYEVPSYQYWEVHIK